MLNLNLIQIFLCLCVSQAAYGINWQGQWAMNCDFFGKDLTSARIRGEDCYNKCASTSGCTHFAWTTQDGGTCWMKTGGASKTDAINNNAHASACGIVSGGGGDNGLGGNDGKFDGSKLVKGKLIWQDEFDSLDTIRSLWSHDIGMGPGGWGNNEKQYYTDRNHYVRDSILTIEAKKEYYHNAQYTSTKLKSRKNFRYGIFEMRAKIPRGRGTWPAFWMLASKQPLNWPDDGEIDIMEHVGYDFGRVHGTIHCGRYNHRRGTQRGTSVFNNDIADVFHKYQMKWTPTSITVYFDDEPYFNFNKESGAYDVWPFDNEHFIILNLAVGGDWGGAQGIDDGIFPAKYEIDYVRVYELP